MKFALSAPSGTGKTTVINLFLCKNPNFELSKSFTTRNSRFNEKHGDEYFFISREEFQEKKEEMFEYEEIFGNF